MTMMQGGFVFISVSTVTSFSIYHLTSFICHLLCVRSCDFVDRFILQQGERPTKSHEATPSKSADGQMENGKSQMENDHSSAFGSTCPPNFLRIADRIFSANVCSCRERNRVYRAAVRTSAGTASSR